MMSGYWPLGCSYGFLQGWDHLLLCMGLLVRDESMEVRPTIRGDKILLRGLITIEAWQ